MLAVSATTHYATFGQVEEMQNSKVIEINGIFLGAAIRLPADQGWRFVAADARAVAADGASAETFTDLRSTVRSAFLSSPTPLPALADAATLLAALC